MLSGIVELKQKDIEIFLLREVPEDYNLELTQVLIPHLQAIPVTQMKQRFLFDQKDKIYQVIVRGMNYTIQETTV